MPNPNIEGKEAQNRNFPIVALCASAGGLQAFEAFFEAIPPDSNLALVVVQHLSPHSESILAELIQRHTQIPVQSITNNIVVQPDNVYVLLPGEEATFWNGQIQVHELKQNKGWTHIIDRFLQSLARDQGEHAAAVILSGAGSDGTAGVRAINANGGLVIAQEPESAAQQSMPLHVIAEGIADAVLEPEQIPAYLLDHFGAASSRALDNLVDSITEEDLQRIVQRLRRLTGHDFTSYKLTALQQQVARRMAALRIQFVDTYLDHLDELPEEAQELEKFLLIHVTRFFRDPEAFEALKTKALLPMLRPMSIDAVFRAWVPGCASGAEAVSIAILLYECLQELDKVRMQVRIFATDANVDMIRRARHGVYPESIAEEITEARLRRHFEQVEGGYRVRDHIRDMILWASHNLVEHPPFSNLHLVSCRNVLIYFQDRLRQRVFAMLQYSLLAESILFLGSSESVPADWNTILPIDRFHRIYRQEADAKQQWLKLDHALFAKSASSDQSEQGQVPTRQEDRYSALVREALVTRYNVTGVIVGETFQVQYTFGEIDRYLHFSAGLGLPRTLFDLIRDDLSLALIALLHRAFEISEPVFQRSVPIRDGDSSDYINLVIQPLVHVAAGGRQRLIIFEPTEARASQLADAVETEMAPYTSIEGRAALIQEIQSTHEQIQIQNEVLETSNEQLKTTSEELNTINNQLIAQNDDLVATQNTLHNILRSTIVGIIFLDLDLLVREYTQAAVALFDLTADDKGQSLLAVNHELVDVDLASDTNDVLDTLEPIEREVSTRGGQRYIMSIHPYRTTQNIIDGLVLTFLPRPDESE